MNIEGYETPEIGRSYEFRKDNNLFLDGLMRVKDIKKYYMEDCITGKEVLTNNCSGKIWTIPNSYEEERDGKYLKRPNGEIFTGNYTIYRDKILKLSEEQIYRDLYEVRQFLSLAKVFKNSDLFISFDISLLKKIVEYIKEINKNYFINLEDPPKDKETLEAEETLRDIDISGGGKYRKKKKSKIRRKYKKSKKQKRKRNKKKTKRR